MIVKIINLPKSDTPDFCGCHETGGFKMPELGALILMEKTASFKILSIFQNGDRYRFGHFHAAVQLR
jgi:hypothetical protein